MATDAKSRPGRSDRAALGRLARALRIFTEFESGRHGTVKASDEALMRLITALGHPIESAAQAPRILERVEAEAAARLIEPVTVCWIGRKPAASIRLPQRAPKTIAWSVVTEDGRTISGKASLADLRTTTKKTRTGKVATYAKLPLPGSTSRTPSDHQLGAGYHRLRVTLGKQSGESLLLCAPKISYQVPSDQGVAGERGGKSLGLFCPTYSIRSERNHGIGDLTDLRDLAAWGADHGADLISTLPLLSGFLQGKVFNPGPYAPVSRLFWNELLLDLERAPGYEDCAEARALLSDSGYRKQTAALRRAKLVDYRAVAAHKRRVLELLAESFFAQGGAQFAAYRSFIKQTPEVKRYARFRATGERQDRPWQEWPKRMRSGNLRAGDFRAEDERYHLYAQFAMHEQLAGFSAEMAERGGKLYLDLPVGTHASGYDIWSNQDLFITDATVGAPPDPAFEYGQNWGFPPMHPEAARESGYAHFIAALRNHLAHAHFLRLDHVMCFYRLFMIPNGMTGPDGVYVGYEHEELFAILCIESHRSNCRLIGENLGTVPPVIEQAMEKHRVGLLYIGQFSVGTKPASSRQKTGKVKASLAPIAANRAASLNTHDLPPFALDLMGGDVSGYLGKGDATPKTLSSTPAEWTDRAHALASLLTDRGYCEPNPTAPQLAAAFNRYIAESEAELALVNIEDFWGETRPQNIPGTSDEYPNWRCKLARTMKDIRSADDIGPVLHDLAERRGSGVGAST